MSFSQVHIKLFMIIAHFSLQKMFNKLQTFLNDFCLEFWDTRLLWNKETISLITKYPIKQAMSERENQTEIMEFLVQCVGTCLQSQCSVDEMGMLTA